MPLYTPPAQSLPIPFLPLPQPNPKRQDAVTLGTLAAVDMSPNLCCPLQSACPIPPPPPAPAAAEPQDVVTGLDSLLPCVLFSCQSEYALAKQEDGSITCKVSGLVAGFSPHKLGGQIELACLFLHNDQGGAVAAPA